MSDLDEKDRKPVQSLLGVKALSRFIRETGFREKMAWVMLSAILLASFFFFGVLIEVGRHGAFADGYTALNRASVAVLLTVMTFIIVVVAIIGAIANAVSMLSEANAPADERDRQVTARAVQLADPVTGIVLFFTLFAYFAGAAASVMACGIVSALLIGTLVDYGARVILYRRGV